MRLRFIGFMVGLGVSLTSTLPVYAQVSDTQVGALVEALRQAAPQTGRADDGLYSDWQIQPQNIPRWSKSCTGKSLTPEQFEASPVTARSILVCVMRDVLKDEYRASRSNEDLAVRRAASWWMTGDPTLYNNADTALYTRKVLNLYRQQKRATAKPTPASKPATTSQPTASSQTESASPSPNGFYDRYMKAGYTATDQKDYQMALVYFKRALDERPNDSYATKAISNVEGYLQKQPSGTPTPQPSPSPTPFPSPSPTSSSQSSAGMQALTQQDALTLINAWLQAKAEIFAPPFDQKRVFDLTTGELLASLVKPDGVIAWLKRKQAYYRYGVQKVDEVERFVASRDRATIELKVTEDRTLYLSGTIAPSQTDFSAQRIRYSLELAEGQWKIADYKTVEGALLERSILGNTSSR